MSNKWDGTPRNETELKFWGDAYLMMSKLLMRDITETNVRQGNSTIKLRLNAAGDIADQMLEAFKDTATSMEDYQQDSERSNID